MSKLKLGQHLFTANPKYTLKAPEGKSRKSIAHRYERRKIRESLRSGTYSMDDL